LVNDRDCDGYLMQNENTKSMKLNTKIKTVIDTIYYMIFPF